MARYKKRPTIQPGMPGLFDDFDDSLFTSADDFPVHPAIEKEAERRLAAEKEKRERMLFDDGDTFSPLEALPHHRPFEIHLVRLRKFGQLRLLRRRYIGIPHRCGSGHGACCRRAAPQRRRHENGEGIALTHDHSDHVRYVYAFLRKYRHMQVFCTPRALNGLLRRHAISNRIKDYHHAIYKEHPFTIGNFTLLAFEVMHDGTDNAGYYITNGAHHIVVATDLGCISERADFYMRKANYLMIEANYNAPMLAAGTYPEYLKARIRSDNGHLDNEVTAEYLARIYTPALRNIFLCHLSKDNNTPRHSSERRGGCAQTGRSDRDRRLLRIALRAHGSRAAHGAAALRLHRTNHTATEMNRAAQNTTTRRSAAACWIEAMRLRTLPVSAAGVVMAAALGVAHGQVRWLPWTLCLIFALLAQIASNFANEYFDFRDGLDRKGRVGPRRGSHRGRHLAPCHAHRHNPHLRHRRRRHRLHPYLLGADGGCWPPA